MSKLLTIDYKAPHSLAIRGYLYVACGFVSLNRTLERARVLAL